jgi:hypothetical protein
LAIALLAASPSTILLAMITLVVFAAGWGWPGLFQLGVIRHNPAHPASAAGVVQAGGFVGGVAGPVAFGATAAAVSYGVAWLEAGIALALAGTFCWLARQAMLRVPTGGE